MTTDQDYPLGGTNSLANARLACPPQSAIFHLHFYYWSRDSHDSHLKHAPYDSHFILVNCKGTKTSEYGEHR